MCRFVRRVNYSGFKYKAAVVFAAKIASERAIMLVATEWLHCCPQRANQVRSRPGRPSIGRLLAVAYFSFVHQRSYILNPKFWKLSQGTVEFGVNQIIESIDQRLVYVHKDTKAKATSSISQAQQFIDAEVGDYFYLTHGNTGIYILGQFIGPANLFSSMGEGWLDRPFRFINASRSKEKYKGQKKWWAPSDNSTFISVPDDELKVFEAEILFPFFGIELSKFGIKLS